MRCFRYFLAGFFLRGPVPFNRDYRCWSRGADTLGLLFVASIIATISIFGAGVFVGRTGAHDLAAWSDPARDQWFRSLKVPGSQTSCCDLRDAAAMNPDKVRQDSAGNWWVDLGSGFILVPPERVVRSPPSIDGLPYIFLMPRPPGSEPAIRCFVAPVPTY